MSTRESSTPPANDGRGVHVVLDPGLVAGVESWRRQQPEIPTRAAAIRRLLQRGLEVERYVHG
jgi:hypothetical protein